MLWLLFALSTLTLYWIYDGYGRMLQIAVGLSRSFRSLTAPNTIVRFPAEYLPEMTVLLTVHNEEEKIVARIQNLLDCFGPHDNLTLLVASDGSTDETDRLVESFADPRVRLYRGRGEGKTTTQNAAISTITSEIVVFTDAGVTFDRDFLRNIAACFSRAETGAAAGYLRFGDCPGSATVRSQGFSWNYELKLRTLESQLGILAVVAGSAFAVRRHLLLPMNPAVGEDCIVPLDVVAQGYRVVHALDALAYDEFGEGTGTTMRARIRMTLRNWQGTWSRSQLLNPLRHPGYAFALWSHKILRWMSPLFLLLATGSALALTFTEPGIVSLMAATPFALLLIMGALGAAGQRLPGAGMAFNFLLANAAFLIGLLRALSGRRVLSYRNG